MSPIRGNLPKKQNRKRENPKQFLPITEPGSGSGSSSTRICDNPACRNVLTVFDTFCKRCSCCICHRYDENKDPSCWLECTSDSLGGSCGLSCHVECALQGGKVGVVDRGQGLQLDGSYLCTSCGKISGILGFWRKQISIAKASRRVDSLYYRINLCFRLLDGTSKFKVLHDIVKTLKAKLEAEFGPLNAETTKTSKFIISRSPLAAEVQASCDAAIEKADAVSATLSNASLDGKAAFNTSKTGDLGPSEARRSTGSVQILHKNPADVTIPQNEETVVAKDVQDVGPLLQPTRVEEQGPLDDKSGPDLSGLGQMVNYDPSKADGLASAHTSHGFDLNIAVVSDIHEDAAPNDSSKDEAGHGSAGFENPAQHEPNKDKTVVESRAVVSRKRPASVEAHDCDSALMISPISVCNGGASFLDESFEYSLKMIRWLERERYIKLEFRQKLFTWLCLSSTEQDRRVINTIIRTLWDDPVSLAGQLVHSFDDIINKTPTGNN